MSLVVNRRPVPLLQISCDCQILQYAANVSLSQTFIVQGKNEGVTPATEVQYQFTMPFGNSAVYKLKVNSSHLLKKNQNWETATNETVEGRVKPKRQAKEEYSDSIAEGKSFSAILKETTTRQGREQTLRFQLGAFECQEPCEEHVIKLTVQIDYVTELTSHVVEDEMDEKPAETWMKFVLPKSLFPANSQGSNSSNSNTSYSFLEPHKFKIRAAVSLAEGQKVEQITSPTHAVVPAEPESSQSVVFVDDVSTLDKDFELLVKPNAEPIAQAIVERMETEDGKEKYAMMIPVRPQFTNVDKINAEFIFLVDCSGSMSGKPITQAARAIKLFIQSLPADCYFNIYRFGSSYDSLFPKSKLFNEESLNAAKQYVEKKIKADLGGTELKKPLTAILQQPTAVAGLAKQLFILTDGEVANADECVKVTHQYHSATRVFSFGIGSGCDRKLVAELAIAGEGHYEFIDYEQRMEPIVILQLKRALMPSFTNATVDWRSLAPYVHPSFVSIPPIYYQSRSLLYAMLDDIPQSSEQLSIKLVAKNNEGNTIEQTIPVNINSQASSSPGSAYPIHLLAAYRKILELDQYNTNSLLKGGQDPVSEIVRLAIKYQLTSSHTALLAVSTNYQNASSSEPTSVTSFGRFKQQDYSSCSDEDEEEDESGSMLCDDDDDEAEIDDDDDDESFHVFKNQKKSIISMKRSTISHSAAKPYDKFAVEEADASSSDSDSDDDMPETTSIVSCKPVVKRDISIVAKFSPPSSPSPAKPQPAADPRSTLDQILFAQKADGSWLLDKQLCALLDVTIPASISQQYNAAALATSLVIHVLNTKYQQFKAEIQFIVQRGIQYLKKTNMTQVLQDVKSSVYAQCTK